MSASTNHGYAPLSIRVAEAIVINLDRLPRRRHPLTGRGRYSARAEGDVGGRGACAPDGRVRFGSGLRTAAGCRPKIDIHAAGFFSRHVVEVMHLKPSVGQHFNLLALLADLQNPRLIYRPLRVAAYFVREFAIGRIARHSPVVPAEGLA